MSSYSSATIVHPATHKEVRINAPPSDATAAEAASDRLVRAEKAEPSKDQKERKNSVLNPQKWNWPHFLSWVPGQLNYQGLKPVIRSSIASWIVNTPIFV